MNEEHEQKSERERLVLQMVQVGLAGLTEQDRQALVSECILKGLDDWKLKEAIQALLNQQLGTHLRELLKTPELQETLRDRAEQMLREALTFAQLVVPERRR